MSSNKLTMSALKNARIFDDDTWDENKSKIKMEPDDDVGEDEIKGVEGQEKEDQEEWEQNNISWRSLKSAKQETSKTRQWDDNDTEGEEWEKNNISWRSLKSAKQETPKERQWDDNDTEEEEWEQNNILWRSLKSAKQETSKKRQWDEYDTEEEEWEKNNVSWRSLKSAKQETPKERQWDDNDTEKEEWEKNNVSWRSLKSAKQETPKERQWDDNDTEEEEWEKNKISWCCLKSTKQTLFRRHSHYKKIEHVNQEKVSVQSRLGLKTNGESDSNSDGETNLDMKRKTKNFRKEEDIPVTMSSNTLTMTALKNARIFDDDAWDENYKSKIKMEPDDDSGEDEITGNEGQDNEDQEVEEKSIIQKIKLEPEDEVPSTSLVSKETPVKDTKPGEMKQSPYLKQLFQPLVIKEESPKKRQWDDNDTEEKEWKKNQISWSSLKSAKQETPKKRQWDDNNTEEKEWEKNKISWCSLKSTKQTLFRRHSPYKKIEHVNQEKVSVQSRLGLKTNGESDLNSDGETNLDMKRKDRKDEDPKTPPAGMA